MTPGNHSFLQAEALYTNHHDWLVRWFYHRLGCNETSADLTQDTFLKLLCKPDLPVIKEPKAYLKTIAHGLAVNHFRRQDVEKAYLEALAIQPEAVDISPEEKEILIETLTIITRILDQLPDRARTVFLLARIDGLPYRQIAQMLDISVNMVQKDMLKAMTACYHARYD